eukprot:403331895
MQSARKEPTNSNSKPNIKLDYNALYEFRKRVHTKVEQSYKLPWKQMTNPQIETLKYFKAMMTDMCMIINQNNFFKICDDLREEFKFPAKTQQNQQTSGLLNVEELQQLKNQFAYQMNRVQTNHTALVETNIGAINELRQQIEELKTCGISPDRSVRLQAQNSSEFNLIGNSWNSGFNEFAQVAQSAINLDEAKDLKKDVEKIQDQTTLILEELTRLKNVMYLQTFRQQNINSLSHQTKIQEEFEEAKVAQINAFRLSHLLSKFLELVAEPQHQWTQMLDLESLIAFIQDGTEESKDLQDLQFLKTVDWDAFPQKNIFLHCSLVPNQNEVPKIKSEIYDSAQVEPAAQRNNKPEEEKKEPHNIVQINQNKQVLNESKKIQSVLFRGPEGALLIGEGSTQVKIFYPDNKDKQAMCIDIGGQLVSAEEITSNYIFLGTTKSQIVILNQLDFSIIKTIQISAKPLQFKSKSVDGEIFVFAFCDKGYIEIINLTSLNQFQQLRHSSNWGLNQAVETSKELEFCLAISEQNDQSFTQGMLGFIRFEFLKDYNTFNLIELKDETYKEIDQDQIRSRPVFNVQEIMQNIFVFTTTLPQFIVYNRTLKQVISRIENPSGSINYNSLQRACIFSKKNPYLIYKDSRSIGCINVVTNEIQELMKVPYRRCGNIYSMLQDVSNNQADSIRIFALYVNSYQSSEGQPDRGIYTLNVNFNGE